MGMCVAIYHHDPGDVDEDMFLLSPTYSRVQTNWFMVNDSYHEDPVCRYIPSDAILEVEWSTPYSRENLVIQFSEASLIRFTP